MDRIAAAEVHTAPFPHILAADAFPPHFYAELQRRKLPDSCYMRLVDTGRVGANYNPGGLCFMPSQIPPKPAVALRGPATGGVSDDANTGFWLDFFAAYNEREFLQCWIARFRDELKARAKSDPERFAQTGGKAEVTSEMFLMREKQSYALNPHTDSPSKAISALFYMPADESGIVMGTSLYAPKLRDLSVAGGGHMDRENFDLIGTILFKPN